MHHLKTVFGLGIRVQDLGSRGETDSGPRGETSTLHVNRVRDPGFGVRVPGLSSQSEDVHGLEVAAQNLAVGSRTTASQK